MKNLAIKFEFGSGVFVTGAQMLVQSGIGLTVFAGTSLLLSSKIELVPMLLCLLIVTRIYGPIITELTLLPELFYHQIAIRRMRTLMNIQPMEGDTGKPVKEYDIELKYYCTIEGEADAINLIEGEGGALDQYNAWQVSELGRDINPSKLYQMLMDAGIKRLELQEPVFTILRDGKLELGRTYGPDEIELTVPQVAVAADVSITNGGYEDE